MVTKKKTEGAGSRPRHENPIGVLGTVDELPPRQYSSVAAELLEAIQAGNGKFVELDPAGRQASSVQSMITGAANKAKVKVTVAVRGERVFAKIEK
jgi:hypothetical protein